MFYIGKEQELNAELLQKMLQRFNTQVRPRLQKYKNYYDGKQKIAEKVYADPNKPCCRTTTNYCSSIVAAYTGYMATPGYISYMSDNDIDVVMDILRYNDYQAADAALLQDALVYGVAAELMFNDADGQTRFRTINPLQCFGVCDDSLAGDLLYFVRYYPVNEWDNSDNYNVDVYSNYDVKHYTMTGKDGRVSFIGEERHYFSQCPANIMLMPDERSIFDCIMPLQDAYNELLTSEIDDFSAFCDAYLTLIGVDAERDDVAARKENRILLLPEGAAAQWLTKNANDTQVENILKRIHDSIYRVSSCVDFSSESLMSGIASGLSIRYKMSGQEHRAGVIEAIMKKALQRRVEIICGIAALKLGEEVFRDISIEFKRNIPEDAAATINLINSLKGTVSDKTLLGQLDFIPDVAAELEALEEQKQKNLELYSFGNAAADNKEDEEE